MARPGCDGQMQKSCYSGHKRMHCLIYQTITTPDGLIFHMYGPEVGRRHDLTLLRQSNIEPQLQTLLTEGRQFYLYGDAAYMLRPWLQVPFERLNATPAQAVYNTRNSAVRVSVEWNYKDLKQMWSRNDFARTLKVHKAHIALMYQASALLLNFKTCLENGGQVRHFFNCLPPNLSQYLNMQWCHLKTNYCSLLASADRTSIIFERSVIACLRSSISTAAFFSSRSRRLFVASCDSW